MTKVWTVLPFVPWVRNTRCAFNEIAPWFQVCGYFLKVLHPFHVAAESSCSVQISWAIHLVFTVIFEQRCLSMMGISFRNVRGVMGSFLLLLRSHACEQHFRWVTWKWQSSTGGAWIDELLWNTKWLPSALRTVRWRGSSHRAPLKRELSRPDSGSGDALGPHPWFCCCCTFTLGNHWTSLRVQQLVCKTEILILGFSTTGRKITSQM